MYDGIKHLVGELKKCESAGATAAAVAMAYICIDTMSFLALPADRSKQGRSDFIAWVDTYLKAVPEQPYQYRGVDVYGGRCAVLHAFSSEVDYHATNPEAFKFGYHDGGKHAFNSEVDPRLVLLGTASFLDDVVRAVGAFLEACKGDADLRARVEARLPTVLATYPVAQ